jgi:hypothetical protein
MKILQPLLVVALELVLAFAAVLLVEHSITGALKAVKVALKSEFTTDAGKLNLVGMLLFVFIYVFSNLHELASTALSLEKPVPPETHTITALIFFGLGFLGSLICVMLIEKKDRDD